jgi:hypothetical protein
LGSASSSELCGGAARLLAEDGVGAGAVSGAAGGFEELYFTGDSLARKSRRLGSRSRRGSWDFLSSLLSEEPQNQPIVALRAKMSMLRC